MSPTEKVLSYLQNDYTLKEMREHWRGLMLSGLEPNTVCTLQSKTHFLLEGSKNPQLVQEVCHSTLTAAHEIYFSVMVFLITPVGKVLSGFV